MQRRTLKEEITVEELPKSLSNEIALERNHDRVIEKLKKLDTKNARRRLEMLKQQLAAKRENGSL
jgi:hypothetical protein